MPVIHKMMCIALHRVYDQLHHVLDDARAKSHVVFVGGISTRSSTSACAVACCSIFCTCISCMLLVVTAEPNMHGLSAALWASDDGLTFFAYTQYSCFAFWPIRSVGFGFGSPLRMRSLQTGRGAMQEKVKTASQTQMVVQGVCAEIPSCNCRRFAFFSSAKLRRHRVLCGPMCQRCRPRSHIYIIQCPGSSHIFRVYLIFAGDAVTNVNDADFQS